MKSSLNRRLFLKSSALATAGAWLTGCQTTPQRKVFASNEKLRCVQIGCGGRGMNHLEWVVNNARENVVALVDPDEKQHVKVKKWLKDHGQDTDKLLVFTDYRRMYDKIGKEIDAVFIATPNHHHAPAAMLAMQRDIGVYCEKPLCHDIAEARKLRMLARKSKAPAQMGNQGHCEEGYHRLCEFVWADVVGKITETHSWTDRSNGGVGPRPPSQPPPAGMHWDEWIGPAPYRDYHTDLHPHEWHGWYDFGNGSIGNMGCHVLDGVFWALKIEHPTSVEAEEIRDGSNERYPTGSRVRWDIPARADMPPLKVYWYEGLKSGTTIAPTGATRSAKREAQNLPPLLAELQKQYPDEEFESNGSIYVGEKGVLYTGTYGGKMHILPLEKMNQMKQPPRSMPRPKTIMTDFLDAIREGKKETYARFEYGSRLTEFTLLGNLAQHAGVGKKVEWDGSMMRVKNNPAVNQWVKRPYRRSWA
jgi:predicted dehydrogenase